MPDSLRTRIAAAIGRDACKDYHGTTDGSTCVFCVDWFLPNANAVIDALNLDISHTYKTSQGREVCVEGFWTEEVNQ